MNQLKKIFLGLAVVALGFVGANNAAAQESCTANSVPTLVRSADITALTGSIVLNCSIAVGAVAGAASITDTIQPGSAVITNSPTVGTPLPPSTNQLPTITVVPSAGLVMTGCAAAGCVVAAPPSGNTLTLPVPAITGCAAVPATATVCSFTITIGVAPPVAGQIASVGIRVNAFASGIVFPAQIAALLTSSPAGVLAVTNNFLNVAIPQVGLGVTFGATPAITSCATAALKGTPTVLTTAPTGVNTPASPFAVTDPVTGVIKAASSVTLVLVGEGFSTAFQPHTVPVTAGGDEGFDASQGTRIVLTLGALPSNVIAVAANYIFAAAGAGLGGAGGLASVGSNVLTLGLVATADGNGLGGGTPAAPTAASGPLASVVTGTTITYEVLVSGPATVDAVNIPIGLYTTGTPGPAGTSTLSAQLAPVSTIGTPLAAPIPRFGASPVSGTLVVVVTCLTNIFFPWVANIVGYDTGFALSNTTTDPFGTASQSGTCVYNFYGSNAPSGGTFTTASFGGGKTDTQLLSIIAPGFSGYVIIQCNFQLGHGFDFIVNGFGGGTPTVGQGGPGMIMAQPTATSGGGSRKSAAANLAFGQVIGEALGH